jgi:hypothetical protein
MNRPRRFALHSPRPKQADRSPAQSLQNYLDTLCGPLTGVLPADRCREVRLEAESHLIALIAELRADGRTAEAATEAALKAYGVPRSLGRTIVRAWNAGAGAHAHRIRNVARLLAFLCVSLMMFESGALLEMNVFDPNGSGTPLGLLFLILSALAALTGGVTAILVPVRSASAAVKMASGWLLYAFAGGFAIPPQQNSVGVALFLLFGPLPISALAAHLVGTRLRRSDQCAISPLTTR